MVQGTAVLSITVEVQFESHTAVPAGRKVYWYLGYPFTFVKTNVVLNSLLSLFSKCDNATIARLSVHPCCDNLMIDAGLSQIGMIRPT